MIRLRVLAPLVLLAAFLAPLPLSGCESTQLDPETRQKAQGALTTLRAELAGAREELEALEAAGDPTAAQVARKVEILEQTIAKIETALVNQDGDLVGTALELSTAFFPPAAAALILWRRFRKATRQASDAENLIDDIVFGVEAGGGPADPARTEERMSTAARNRVRQARSQPEFVGLRNANKLRDAGLARPQA